MFGLTYKFLRLYKLNLLKLILIRIKVYIKKEDLKIYKFANLMERCFI